MSDELVIEQKQGLGNAGTQVGVQNNYGLSPVEATRMAFEIFREYYPQLREEALKELNNLVEDKLSSIPQELIDSPKPRIAVPTLQNASITEEREVRELYANLLANSMNKVVKNGVHPGFVEIIKQLSPDEAKILRYLYDNSFVPTVALKVHKENGETVVAFKLFTNIGELCDCEDLAGYEKYIDNLIRLGLINASREQCLADKSRYDSIKNHSYILSRKAYIENMDKVSKVDFVEGYIELTVFGKAFCSICLQTQNSIIESPERDNCHDQL